MLDHFAENHGSYYRYVVLIDVHTDSSWILSYIYMGVVLLQDTIFNKCCIRSGTCKPINFTHTHTHTHTHTDCICHFSLDWLQKVTHLYVKMLTKFSILGIKMIQLDQQYGMLVKWVLLLVHSLSMYISYFVLHFSTETITQGKKKVWIFCDTICYNRVVDGIRWRAVATGLTQVTTYMTSVVSLSWSYFLN